MSQGQDFQIGQYETPDGVVPFAEWFHSLHAKAAAKVGTAIARMQLGNFGDHHSVGKGVFERRIDFEKGYRIYYAQDGTNVIILLSGGIKTRQQKDINNAIKYWNDYKKRKRSGET